MASKKLTRKTSQGVTPWLSSWGEMDKVFENFRRDLEKSFASFPSISMPHLPKITETSCDIIDEGKQLRVKVDMPGVTKKEILLNVTDTTLDIHAEHKEKSEEKKKNYLRKERSEISYDRIIPLPEKIVPGKVKSKLTDGVLEITLPKSKPTPVQKKRSIKIQ